MLYTNRLTGEIFLVGSFSLPSRSSRTAADVMLLFGFVSVDRAVEAWNYN